MFIRITAKFFIFCLSVALALSMTALAISEQSKPTFICHYVGCSAEFEDIQALLDHEVTHREAGHSRDRPPNSLPLKKRRIVHDQEGAETSDCSQSLKGKGDCGGSYSNAQPHTRAAQLTADGQFSIESSTPAYGTRDVQSIHSNTNIPFCPKAYSTLNEYSCADPSTDPNNYDSISSKAYLSVDPNIYGLSSSKDYLSFDLNHNGLSCSKAHQSLDPNIYGPSCSKAHPQVDPNNCEASCSKAHQSFGENLCDDLSFDQNIPGSSFASGESSQSRRGRPPVDPDRKGLRCDVCSRTCSNKYNLRIHQLTHNNNNSNFSCDICSRSFKCKGYLIRHRLYHFPDSTCVQRQEPKKAAARKSNVSSKRKDLVRHKKTEEEEKPFTCNLCNKKFKQKSSLSRHKRTHGDKAVFTCDICNQKFTFQCNLHRHKKGHQNHKGDEE